MFGSRWKAALEAVKETHAAAMQECAKTRVHLERDLRVARAQVLYLERALSTSQANVDWLRVMVNKANDDRAAIAASKGLELPSLQIDGTPQSVGQVEARAAAAANQPVEDGKSFVDIEDLDGALAAYAGQVSNFEDLGDEEAKRQGIGHADDGTVEYSKP